MDDEPSAFFARWEVMEMFTNGETRWRLSSRAQDGRLGDRLVSYFHHKLNRQTHPEPPWMAPGSAPWPVGCPAQSPL